MGLRRLLSEAERLLARTGVAKPAVQPSRDPRFGEVTSTAAFLVARELKRDPREVAEDLASRIDLSEAELVESVEHVNGYLNFKVDWTRYAKAILDEIFSEGAGYGSSGIGEGRRIIIEHTSVNPNKPLHVGHARNVCLGDTLSRIFRFLGYEVVVLNYVDDSGAQMADLILGFTKLGYPLEPPPNARFDEYCGDVVYVESVRRAESDPSLAEERRRIVREIESGSGEAFRLNKLVVEKVLRDQLETCRRLGARYDILNLESAILEYGLWEEVFEKLRRRRAVYYAAEGSKAGCWLLDLSGHPILSREGDEVLVRSDGTTTYTARDIAYAAWKLGGTSKDFEYDLFGENPDGSPIYITSKDGELRKPIRDNVEKVVNVIDVRQRRPQEIVRYALKLLGLEFEKYVHYGYEVVALSRKDAERMGYEPEPDQKIVHMSGRRGLYVKADRMLDMLKARAGEEVRRRHPEWGADRVEENAEKIAIAALRYSLIKQDLDKPIILDTDEMLKLEGDTGPYLQYTYARACRILEKADSSYSTQPYGEIGEDEKRLLRRMSYLPILLDEFPSNLMIKPLANYAYKLASEFNVFYEHAPVLQAEENVRKFRLAVVKAFTTVFSIVLNLLGVPLLEVM